MAFALIIFFVTPLHKLDYQTLIQYILYSIGLQNSGKTTIVNEILKKLSEKPYYAYVHKFSCVKNKGRKPESIQRDLRQALNKCLLHYPAVLVMDTMDYLTQAEGEQPSQDSDYFNK